MKRIKVLLVLMVAVLAALTLYPVSAQGDLGSPDNPIQAYFVPSVEAQVLVEGGDVLKAALEEATGLTFEVAVPTSYAATIEGMCASPGNSVGFIPAAGFVIGNNRCGIEVGAAAVRFGRAFYWSQILVQRDNTAIRVLGDLEGKSWAYVDAGSTSSYIVPSVEFAALGIEPGERVEAGSHNAAVLAVYNGEVDFATSFYSPPLMPGAPWQIGDIPEPYDLSIDEAFVNEDDRLFVGDVRVLDSRASVRDVAPDIVDKVRILAISDPIPNDTVSFGPDFPQEVRDQIIDALIAFSGTEGWEAGALGNDDGYSWDSIERVSDSAFDSVRLQFEILGLTEDDVFGG
jgi:phosphonate transport system substrate-binding protein